MSIRSVNSRLFLTFYFWCLLYIKVMTSWQSNVLWQRSVERDWLRCLQSGVIKVRGERGESRVTSYLSAPGLTVKHPENVNLQHDWLYFYIREAVKKRMEFPYTGRCPIENKTLFHIFLPIGFKVIQSVKISKKKFLRRLQGGIVFIKSMEITCFLYVLLRVSNIK